MASPYASLMFGNYQANNRPLYPGSRPPGNVPTSAGGLPIQKAETSSRRDILPAGYATLRDYLAGGIPTLTGGARTTAKLDELNADPLKSTLFQNTITPLLASMVPGEIAARRSLTDRFRQSGQLQSGAFAEQARLQESDILGNRNEVVAKHAGDIYSRFLQSLGLGLQAEQASAQPFQLGTTLLQALRNEGADVTGGQYSMFDPIATAAASRGGGYSGGSGGSTGGGGDYPSGVDVNNYPLSKIPYNPHNPFDFRGGSTSAKGAPPVSYTPPPSSSDFRGFDFEDWA